jgi:pseudouridine-5'-phosphate glycosidase
MTSSRSPAGAASHDALADLMVVTPEVADALAGRRPVVALESTIVTHGMPYPENIETARAVEATVRAHGAVPATIAVLDGRIRIGLSEDDLDRLALASGVLKLSRADLPIALVTGQPGSTTVAATMIAAHLAGIAVFATGGIGGVHRGAESSFDMSADLTELARTPVIVVSAGAKALLDLPKTLERLETDGVPVIGYRTAQFPAFWSRASGLRAPLRLDDVGAIATFWRTKNRLGLTSGMVVANPVPEEAEIPSDEIDGIIEAAIVQSAMAHVSAKDVTPFILRKIVELTGGRSLTTNIALVRNNAALAGDLAVALAG